MSIKNKFIIYILVFIAIYSVIIYFIIMPTINDMKAISQAIFNERIELEKKYLKGQLLRKTLSDFETVKAQDEKLSSIFVKSGEELEFIKILENLAKQNNVALTLNLKDSKSTSQAAKNELSALSLEITAVGLYPKTLLFLNSIEKLPYYFNIEKITISAFRQELTGSVTLQITGTIFTGGSQSN